MVASAFEPGSSAIVSGTALSVDFVDPLVVGLAVAEEAREVGRAVVVAADRLDTGLTTPPRNPADGLPDAVVAPAVDVLTLPAADSGLVVLELGTPTVDVLNDFLGSLSVVAAGLSLAADRLDRVGTGGFVVVELVREESVLDRAVVGAAGVLVELLNLDAGLVVAAGVALVLVELLSLEDGTGGFLASSFVLVLVVAVADGLAVPGVDRLSMFGSFARGLVADGAVV